MQLSIQKTESLQSKQLKTHPRASFIVVFGCVLVFFYWLCGLFGLLFYCFALVSALFLFLFLVEWSVMWGRRWWGESHCTGVSNVSQIPNTKSPFSLCCNPPIFLRKNSAVRFVSFHPSSSNSSFHPILPILLLRKVEWYGWYEEE